MPIGITSSAYYSVPDGFRHLRDRVNVKKKYTYIHISRDLKVAVILIFDSRVVYKRSGSCTVARVLQIGKKIDTATPQYHV